MSRRATRSVRGTRSASITCLLLLHVLCSALCYPAHADEIRADRSETHSQGRITSRNYAGDVRATFEQSRIAADSAVVSSDSKQYRFFRDVRFQDGRYVVYADTVIYDVSNRMAVLSGRVRLSDDERHLSAERVTYRSGEQTVEASGNVHIGLPEDAGTVRSDYWFRDVVSDSSIGNGNVRFTRHKSDTLVIAAHSVSSHRLAARLRFVRDVTIHQGQWRAHSRVATFLKEAELVILEVDARLFRASSETDSVSAVADRVELSLRDNAISEMGLLTNARIDLLKTRPDGPSTSTVSSDTSRVTLEHQQVTALRASGHVNIRLDTPGSASSRLGGEVAHIVFENGEPKRIRVEGAGNLSHERSDGTLQANITGYGLTIDLIDSELHAVRVDSNAVCELVGERPMRLSGDRLSLMFELGNLVRAEVEGDVQGQYRSEEARR